MKEDNDNNNENRVTTETLFSDIKETEIRNGKEYIQIEDSYVDGDRVYINPKTSKKIVYIDGLSPIMLEVGTAIVKGYLDIMQDNYGFLRDKTLRNTKNDVYVSQTMIKLFGLAIGDSVLGITREAEEGKYPALIYVVHINDKTVSKAFRSKKFDSLIPMYPLEKLEIDKGNTLSNRIISLISPIGKGQRALIVSPPKAGKTTMLKEIAISLKENCKSAELMVLLIDERPEEVTDIEDTIGGYVISSTFDQKPEDHIHIAEFALEIAKRKVENGKDVVVLLDSITRLARAYNLTVPSSGKLLSGGFDPNALYRPKKFFGAARNTKEAGSLTIIATALVDTGSRLDDVVYEEFKGTGNMELHLDRNIAEMRIFPAINVKKSSTRKDELLYGAEEKKKIDKLRTKISGLTDVEATKTIISLLKKTKTNDELIEKL
ncbi:MAG: transcription termination factor Rho [Clostridiales bacterium]|nr:transcription termination factor Rho [Clostridiales bacterium]